MNWIVPLTPSFSGSGPRAEHVQTSWYASGRMESRAELEDGVREGPATEWYANGQERCSGKYAQGLREGTWAFYTSDGKLDAERSGTYSAGVRVGA